MLRLWRLTPLLTIFQICRGGQFYFWCIECQEKTWYYNIYIDGFNKVGFYHSIQTLLSLSQLNTEAYQGHARKINISPWRLTISPWRLTIWPWRVTYKLLIMASVGQSIHRTACLKIDTPLVSTFKLVISKAMPCIMIHRALQG